MSMLEKVSKPVTALCLLGLLVLLVPAVARAEEYRVSTDQELRDALAEADLNGEDDAITLAAGTYAGPFYFNPLEARSLILKGEVYGDPSQVVLEGVESPISSALGIGCGPAPGLQVTVQDLTLQRGRQAGLSVYCQTGALGLTVERVVIQDNSTLGYGGGAMLRVDGPAEVQATLRDCVIRDNQAIGQDGRLGRGGGLCVEVHGGGRFSLALVNSLVYQNQSNWPGGGLSFLAGGDEVDSQVRVTVVNSTITGNRSGMYGSGFAFGGGMEVYARPAGVTTTVELYNTILYGNEAGGSAPGDDLFIDVDQAAIGLVAAHSCDVGEVEQLGGAYQAIDGLQADPLFADAVAGDLHLGPDSPCIDAGTAAVPYPPGLPVTDLDGRPRISGWAPDLGAYERGGGVLMWLPLILKLSGA